MNHQLHEFTHKIERHVVLVKPEVPWNTGNIGRTCLGAGAYLHLIKPLGFSLDNRDLKRAGLDYWHKVKLSVWDDFDNFQEKMGPATRRSSTVYEKRTRFLLVNAVAGKAVSCFRIGNQRPSGNDFISVPACRLSYPHDIRNPMSESVHDSGNCFV